MPLNNTEVANALSRGHLDFFVQQVVATLNPGDPYVAAPHVGAMCQLLTQVDQGEITKAIITVPPRHLKSTVASVAYVARALGHDPTLKFVVASYGEELATKHARDFRTVVETDWYRALFPNMHISRRRNTATELQTTVGGGRRAVSLGGPLTGMGADVIIIDDLMKAADAGSATERERARDYYEQTLFSRLDNKATGRIIVVQQRLHEDDLVGYLLEKGDFTHLNLPAIARRDEVLALPRGRSFHRRLGEALCPERESLDTLENKIRRQVGNTTFETQWQQDPTTSGADFLRVEHFKRYGPNLTARDTVFTLQSWDTAIAAGPTNDYSVCMTFGYHPASDAWLMLDLVRVRKEYAELQGLARALCDRWRPDRVIIEESGMGRALAHHLRQHGERAWSWPVKESKEERLAAGSPLVVEGKVLVPREAAWLEGLFAELRKFPNGKHDDQVDALSLFLNDLRGGRLKAIVRASMARESGEDPPRREIRTWRPRRSLREHILDSYDRDAPTLPLGSI
jgi:predicted phage terminase large subunit-like protein